MIIILGAIGVYILLAAALVVFACMFSSRLSRQEGYEERYETKESLSEQRADNPLRSAPSGAYH